jgi:exosortase
MAMEPALTRSSMGDFLVNFLSQPKRRWILLGLWMAVGLALSWWALGPLIHYASTNDDASHILLIPLISAYLIFIDRRAILRNPSSDVTASLALLLPGIIFAMYGSLALSLPACALGLVLLCISGFAMAFGRSALKAAQFPLLFLFLFVPLPEVLLDKVIYALQRGSAEISAVLFNLTDLPVLREGFVFRLPRFSIEVAKECSGIRSSIALFVLAVLVGHFFLHKVWKQVVFLLAGFVVMIIKNGIRIVTLTWLADRVDPGFLHGNLHREGGIVFFMIGLVILAPIFWWLQRGEEQRPLGGLRTEAKAI